jgi:uncharacterized protein (DUF305 family)
LRFGGEERHVPQVSAFCGRFAFGKRGNDVVPAAERNARRGYDRAAGCAGEEQQDPDTGDRECAFAEAVDFMQGMIMHHSQAVEMTELLRTRSKDPAVQALGKRISISQTDEMAYMKQWLTDRGEPISAPGSMNMTGDMAGMDMAGMDHMDHMDHGKMGAMPMMPGMLTAEQMKALAAATGPEFDHLFLTGMIQHHTGALTMVRELFRSPGAGQDPQLFDFASDVDNTQQAEIDIMRHMLKEKQ